MKATEKIYQVFMSLHPGKNQKEVAAATRISVDTIRRAGRGFYSRKISDWVVSNAGEEYRAVALAAQAEDTARQHRVYKKKGEVPSVRILPWRVPQ